MLVQTTRYRWQPPRGTLSLDESSPFFPTEGDVYDGANGMLSLFRNRQPVTVGGSAQERVYVPPNLVGYTSANSATGYTSAETYTPPLNITIFGVLVPQSATWQAGSALNATRLVGGFGQTDNGDTICLGGNASFVVGGLVNDFGNSPGSVALTYSDATNEYVKSGTTTANTNPWFIAASYKDASTLEIVCRDLVAGTIVSSTTAKTKSLKSVTQPFDIFSNRPNSADGNFVRSMTGVVGIYAAWTPYYWTNAKLLALAQNPWQIFRPQRRRIYVGVSAGGNVKSFTGTLSFVGAQSKFTSQGQTATLSFIGAFVKRTAKPLVAAGLSFAGVFAKLPNKAATATLSFTGAQTKFTSHLLTAGLSFTGACAKFTRHFFTAGLSFVGAFIGSRLSLQSLTAALSFTGAQSRLPMKAATATLSFVGAQSRRISHLLTGVLSFSGFLAAVKSGVNALFFTATLTFTGAQTFFTRKGVSAALSFVGSLLNTRLKVLTAVLSFVGSTRASTSKSLASALSFVGTLPKKITHSFQAALSFLGTWVFVSGAQIGVNLRWLLVMRTRVRYLASPRGKLDYSPKAVGETEKFLMNFASELSAGELITNAVWTATPINGGVDSNSGSMILGTATIVGSVVSQKITLGVAGVTYLIQCAISTSLGPQTIFGRANLVVTS